MSEKRENLTRGIVALMLLMPVPAIAQEQSLASTLNVYVFPSEGQDSSQQSRDESDCYQWAVSNTGSDPFELAKQQAADVQQTEAELEAQAARHASL